MSITICDTHLTRTVRYLSLTFEPVYSTSKLNHYLFLLFNTSATPKAAIEVAINPVKNVPVVLTPV